MKSYQIDIEVLQINPLGHTDKVTIPAIMIEKTAQRARQLQEIGVEFRIETFGSGKSVLTSRFAKATLAVAYSDSEGELPLALGRLCIRTLIAISGSEQFRN